MEALVRELVRDRTVVKLRQNRREVFALRIHFRGPVGDCVEHVPELDEALVAERRAAICDERTPRTLVEVGPGRADGASVAVFVCEMEISHASMEV